jgi:DDB1- and CUL4-associated factor 1
MLLLFDLVGGNATPNPNPEVLTTSEKQIAYHTCVALRQYFRSQLLLLVDYLRPNKGTRGVRSSSGARAAYKPLDISIEAIDAVFVQIQRDRKLGTNLVRARWPVVDRFLALNGHITMLELCQVCLFALICWNSASRSYIVSLRSFHFL